MVPNVAVTQRVSSTLLSKAYIIGLLMALQNWWLSVAIYNQICENKEKEHAQSEFFLLPSTQKALSGRGAPISKLVSPWCEWQTNSNRHQAED